MEAAKNRPPVANISYRPSSFTDKTDVFKARMQQIAEEKPPSNSSNLIQTLFQIGLVVGGILASVFLVLVTKSLATEPKFCGGNLVENCMKCPEHAVCSEGTMKCEPPFKKEGWGCVEDKTFLQTAHKEAQRVSELLRERAANEYLLERTYTPLPFSQIKEFVPDTILEKTVQELVLSNKVPGVEVRNGQIHPKEPYLSLSDLSILFWQDNKYHVLLCSILILVLAQKVYKFNQGKFYRRKAKEMYEVIVKELKDNVDDTPEHGVTEETLLASIQSHFNKNYSDIIWPMIEDLRKQDKNVTKFEAKIKGRPQILWQWNKREENIFSKKSK